MTLSPTDLDTYRSDGFLSPLRALPEAEAKAHMATLEQIEASRGGRIPPVLNAKAHLVVPFLWDLIQDPRLTDPVSQILGPDLLCWGSSFFSKHPGTVDRVPWHQDGTYWGLTEPAALTVWLALTPATVENGCMSVIPGTHDHQMRHHAERDPTSMLPVGEEVKLPRETEQRAVACTLSPGEMSIHHVRLVHGSEANHSDQRRVGFVIRYIAGNVAQRSGARGYAALVRGRDHGTFELETRPEALFDPRAMGRHRKIIRSFADVVTEAAADHERSAQ